MKTVHHVCIGVSVVIVLTFLVWLFFVPVAPSKLIRVQETLKTRLCIFVDVLDRHGYTCFLDGGSLLGCIREGGIIPHDDDVDFGMLQVELDKLMQDQQVMEELKQHDLVIRRSFPCYKLKCISCSDSVFIDIFGYDIVDGKLLYHRKRNRRHWINNWFHESEVYPLKRVQFEKCSVWIPRQAVPYLQRQYGKNWLIPKKRVVTHKFLLLK